MAQNEKIRTEDIIEILDGKILTTEGHVELDVLPRENYNSVLTKISQRVLTVGQKAAFDAALTTPSSLNPVVLKNDLVTYIPQADLGSVKDSVTYFSELPLPYTATGTIVDNESTITDIVLTDSINNTLERGKLVTTSSSLFAAGTMVIDVLSTTEVRVGLIAGGLVSPSPALGSGTNVTITFSPVDGELRGVINDMIIYRWNGSAWVAFTRTGTLKHTELKSESMNASNSFVHLTNDQKTIVLATTHSHSNKLVLDAILSAGSGRVITSAERAALPTAKQKEALAGTSGVPSASNPYVTNADPRLNAARNPYVTIGPPGSLATFQGVDYNPFNDALQAIDIGSASTVKAIEVLAGSYNLGGVSLIWNNPSSLLMEDFTPNTATLSFFNTPWGIQGGIPTNTIGDPVILRGFVFELNDQGTSGIRSYRDYTLIEDCVFMPGPSVAANQVGISLFGKGSIVRRCRFINGLTKGVIVNADNCRVESCTFDLENPLNTAIEVASGGDFAVIDHNTFLSGLVTINSGVSYSNLINNRFYASTLATTIIDNGTSSRLLENQPEDINQPFIGRTRTVGYVGTYADYRGNTEAPFLAALLDPNVTEVEVLEGTYNFSSSVTVPLGKTVRGVRQGATTSGVTILAAAGVNPFVVSQSSRLENLVINGSNNSLVTAASGLSDVVIEHCKFNLSASNASSQYEIVAVSPQDWHIRNCIFNGVRGLSASGSTRARLSNCVFLNSTSSLVMSLISLGTKDHIKGNHFITSTAPVIAGSYLLVENNHFLGDLPTKTNTTSSVWQGNWPHPSANNDAGMDTITINMDRYLEPNSGGVAQSIATGVGSLCFDAGILGVSSTLPITLPAKIDKTKSYTIDLYWTAPTGSIGSVYWRVTAVFRNATLSLATIGTIGTSNQASVQATRTNLKTLSDEDKTSTITLTSFGLGLLDPTHMSVIVERLGNDLVNDTLRDSTTNAKSVAYLTDVKVTLNRD